MLGLIYLSNSCPMLSKFFVSLWNQLLLEWVCENISKMCEKLFQVTELKIKSGSLASRKAMNVSWQWDLMFIFIWYRVDKQKGDFNFFHVHLSLLWVRRRRFFLLSAWADATVGARNECESAQSALLIDCATRPESTEIMRGHALDSQDYPHTPWTKGSVMNDEISL